MRKTLLGIAVACLVAGGAFANGPIGTQIRSWETESSPFYIPCVGEYVINYAQIEARYHIFQTSSGTVHIIDQWSVKSLLVGQDTNTMWLGYGNAPLEFNAKLEAGGVKQWVSRGRFVPLEGHATALIVQNTMKITVNANGELVVLHEEEPPDFQCVGPQK